MKKIAILATIIISGCTSKPYECSAPEAIALLESIFNENLEKSIAKSNKDYDLQEISKLISFKADVIRPRGYEKESNRWTCDTEIIISHDASLNPATQNIINLIDSSEKIEAITTNPMTNPWFSQGLLAEYQRRLNQIGLTSIEELHGAKIEETFIKSSISYQTMIATSDGEKKHYIQAHGLSPTINATKAILLANHSTQKPAMAAKSGSPKECFENKVSVFRAEHGEDKLLHHSVIEEWSNECGYKSEE